MTILLMQKCVFGCSTGLEVETVSHAAETGSAFLAIFSSFSVRHRSAARVPRPERGLWPSIQGFEYRSLMSSICLFPDLLVFRTRREYPELA